MKSLMVGDQDTESALESKTRLYSSEAEIRQDQEKVIDAVLKKYSGFDYLRKNADLSSRVRTGSLEGVREGIATFMGKNGITDIRDVFEFPHDFYHNEFIYEAIKTRLIEDDTLRNQWTDAERPSVTKDRSLAEGFTNQEDCLLYLFTYECEHIAEVISCTYVNEVDKKILVWAGLISPEQLSEVSLPYAPHGLINED